jgi:DNA-binding CsgD family transcriptional regulator
MRILRPLIMFDGAVLMMGAVCTKLILNQIADPEYLEKDDAFHLDNYADATSNDPISSMLSEGLSAPYDCECDVFFKTWNLPELHTFSKKNKFKHLLLYGERALEGCAGKWLVLYRCVEDKFDPQESNILHAIWRHLVQAITINLNRALDAADATKNKRASALISPYGTIEAADPGFLELLNMEWPDSKIVALPKMVCEFLSRGHMYRGRNIKISMSPKHGYIVCVASRIPLLETLSPGEQRVAERFVTGMNHKEIAYQLGISPYTARTQIANVYRKLKIHDRFELASKLSHN